MKEIKYSELYSAYGRLLTAVQAEITEMYYAYDLTLSEIAEIKGVTRQSIADAIKKVRAELDDLELKLGIVRKKHAIMQFAQQLPEDEKVKLTGLLED